MTVDAPRRSSPFEVLARTPAQHLDLYSYAAILRLRLALPGIADETAERIAPFAFLDRYFAELPDWATADPIEGPLAWHAAIESWELDAPDHLPLRALRDDGAVDHLGLTALAAIALPDEDPRFGSLFGALQGGAIPRPTAGTLAGWWAGPGERRLARRAIDGLIGRGIVEPAGPETPSGEPPLRPAAGITDVLRGESESDLGWCRLRPPGPAPALSELILDESIANRVSALAGMVADGSIRTIVIRGPGRSGRRSVLAAIARSTGHGTIELDRSAHDERRWRMLGVLAIAARAMPILRLDPAIGETIEVAAIDAGGRPVGITLPPHGSVRGPDLDEAVTLELRMPLPSERRRHWVTALTAWSPTDASIADDLATRSRMTGGNIRRVARMAGATAALDGRRAIAPTDVREASRALRTRALEPLAVLLETGGGWDDLVVHDDVRRELSLLEQRCRSRERLVGVLPGATRTGSAGVRALFIGPSGAGKTLAARVLGSVLEMDVYAVEVGRLVDKYLGETEKNLTSIFANASELDAIVLLDEGDSLMASRTDVRNSNDRYANLQTNHLLQQLEAHDGIVLVTTNATDRIDQAFLRRIDVVLEFRAPDATQRWEIWRRHLPVDHDVDDDALAEIASRCTFMGGQIRNAVLHAWLLALEDGGEAAVPATRHVDAAVRREYRKIGATCPLPAEGWLR